MEPPTITIRGHVVQLRPIEDGGRELMGALLRAYPGEDDLVMAFLLGYAAAYSLPGDLCPLELLDQTAAFRTAIEITEHDLSMKDFAALKTYAESILLPRLKNCPA